MLIPRPAGPLPPVHAIRRVRAVSFSATPCTSTPLALDEHQPQSSRKNRSRRFTTVSTHASAPARPTLFDARPCSRRASTPTASSTVSATYVAPSKPSLRRHKSIWHSPSCTWVRQTGPRDKTCPGCATEVAASEPSDELPYEFSPREAIWQQHLNDLKTSIQRDPYEAMFGFSNRLLKGQALPSGWWEHERRPRRNTNVDEPVTSSAAKANDKETSPRGRKDSGVDVLEASYSWTSSGYDARTGQSWSRGADMVYDPIEGKMVPKTSTQTLPPQTSTAHPQPPTSRTYDTFENQQHQAEADAMLQKSFADAFGLQTSSPRPSDAADKASKYAKAKQALEKGWAAEKKNSPRSSASEESASAANAEFPGNSILSTQQREWERNVDNAERAASAKHAQTTAAQSSSPSPQAWRDFKAGKVVKPAAKSSHMRSPLHSFTMENGSSYACMSLLCKDKPLKHMNLRELNRHKAAIIGAFEKRAKAAAAAQVSSPTDKTLRDEVERQKLAMTAWEGRWRARSQSAPSSPSPVPASAPVRQAAWSNAEHSSSSLAGEGDIDAKVVDFCTDSAGWYKKPAPHAANTPAAQDKLAAAALVDEMRSIYESAYGVINVQHRQGTANIADSLKEFDEQPQPEQLDLALREFEATKRREELDSALDEYEQRRHASSVDDSLKIYEREPKEGIDHALRQFEKHAANSPNVAAPVVSSWEPRVVQRLEPAIDRMPSKKAAPSVQADESLKVDTEVVGQDEFSYKGEKDKFGYEGALEECSSQPSYQTDKAKRQSERSAPWGVNPARRARTLRRSAINPIDGTTAPRDEPDLTTQTGNFASPTGFVNHDVPAAAQPSSSTANANPAARKVRRVEQVFSGAQPLQKESIPEIVEHFRRLGLGPELEAYARSSTLLDRTNRSSGAPSTSGSGSRDEHTSGSGSGSGPGSGSGSGSGSGGRTRGRGGAAKAVLLTIPAVLGVMYAAGVVVEYFRDEEDARRRGLAPALPASPAPRELDAATLRPVGVSDDDQRGWGPVLRTSSLRRRREAAAAAAARRAADEEEQQQQLQAWAAQQAQAQEAQAWRKLDDDLRAVGHTLWAGVGAALAAVVLICSLGNGGG